HPFAAPAAGVHQPELHAPEYPDPADPGHAARRPGHLRRWVRGSPLVSDIRRATEAQSGNQTAAGVVPGERTPYGIRRITLCSLPPRQTVTSRASPLLCSIKG